MTVKIGLEQEGWCFTANESGAIKTPCEYAFVPDGIPRDECGYLVEARTPPMARVDQAVWLLCAERESIDKQLRKHGLASEYSVPSVKVPRHIYDRMLRDFGKGRVKYHNLYGDKKRLKRGYTYIGLHVHFSNTFLAKDGEHHLPMNMPIIIRSMDEFFKREIKEAGRVPGSYEMKVHGFEYRSLPAFLGNITYRQRLEEGINYAIKQAGHY